MASFPWWFRITDYVAPWLYNRVPGVFVGGVDQSTSISFDLLDDYSGVDPSTLFIQVAGADAYNGLILGGFISPFSGTIVPIMGGYAVSLSRLEPFSPSSAVEVRVSARDYKGNPLSTADGYWTFYTETAVIGLNQGPFEITLDVLFNGPMLQNDAFLDPGNYQFNGNMYTRLVEKLELDEVRLWVELFQGVGPFTLTVSPNVKDSYGAFLSGAAAQFEIPVFQSDAMMSATNGLVRTWAGRTDGYGRPLSPCQGSRFAVMDSQRIYLAGLRGIDVFRRDTLGTVVRWAQVMDEYGIDTMFVANYDDDFVFENLIPPFLEDLMPAAGSTDADGTTDIIFTISDAVTAVEIVASAIYVNGMLVFAGSGGWLNDWSGDIIIRYRSLDFILRPPVAFTPGTSVSVRVMAFDLLSNVLDTTYMFQISTTPSGGFGLGPFGSGLFGGGV